MPKVIVSGANGFLGQHIVKQLLEKKYTVVGTVRSKEKGELLAKDFVGDFSYEVVADFVNPESFDGLLKKHSDAIGFFHNASPAFFAEDNFEEKVILPAIEGTKNLLESAQKYSKNLKKFIYTSSTATIASKDDTKATVLTEETWNNFGRNDFTNGMEAYYISKTYAEKALWEFSKTKNASFGVSAILPNIVLGPQAFDSNVKETLNVSAEFVTGLLKLGPNDPIPSIVSTGFIDVRDCARAHIYAFEADASNQRIFCSRDPFTIQSVLDIIHKHFPQLDHLPKGEPGTADKELAELPTLDNSKSNALVAPVISLEQSVVDSIKQVLANRK